MCEEPASFASLQVSSRYVCIIQIDLRPLQPNIACMPMDRMKNWAVLFDFDGVIMDTEKQYSAFWNRIGRNYLGLTDLEVLVKGQTLSYIFSTFFRGKIREREEISKALNRFELEMDYEYVPGVTDFVEELKRNGVPTAVVTSSNELKMAAVYNSHPEVRTLFGPVLTADMFTASKPDPQCFLLGMKTCGSTPESTFVFEDSVNGLNAGMASGATVIGLTTTNPRKTVEPLCHYVIDDFRGFTLEKMLEIKRTGELQESVSCHAERM